MGIDYYNCSKCSVIYDDCRHRYNCCEQCDHIICYNCQVELKMRTIPEYSDRAQLLGHWWIEDEILGTCPYCEGTMATDREILEYLLSELGKSRDDIINNMKKIS